MFLLFLTLSVLFTTSNADERRTLPTPYRGLVSEKLEPGHFLSIQGRFPADRKRTSVNLLMGGLDIDHSDVILHVNFRFDEKQIVYNKKLGEDWGYAEESGKLPFQPGDEFQMRILIDDTGFQIFQNGTPHAHFDSNTANLVDHVYIPDVMELYEAKWYHTLRSFVKVYDGALRHGHVQKVDLIPYGKFTIDFLKDDNDIGFHLSIELPRGQMSISTLLNSKYEPVESTQSNPFTIGNIASIEIRNTPRTLNIFANGRPMFEFNHRTRDSNDDYRKLAIYGNVLVLTEELRR